MNAVESQLIITIIGAVFTWTVSVIGACFWLSSKFRALERLIDRETAKVHEEIALLGMKVQRLELKAFGFTTPDLLPKSSSPSSDQGT